MSYLIYVTRAEYSFEREEHPIPEPEWLALAARDTSLHHDLTQPYGRLGKSGEEEILYPWVWKAHPDGDEVLFWFDDGAIECKNADEYAVDKLFELAQQLGARVIDEDDHVYNPSSDKDQSDHVETDSNAQESDHESLENKLADLEVAEKKPWWVWFFETKK